jgi:signal transduction histidine kinase
MSAKNRSLTALLAWRLVGLQILIILGVIVGLTYTFYNENVAYVGDWVPRTILHAVSTGDHGELVLDDDQELQKLRRSAPALWFAVEDEQGRRLQYGNVPDVYRPLVASLWRLQPSEIHDGHAPYNLGMRVYVEATSVRHIRVICGGAPSTGPSALFFTIADYLGWRMILPLALVTLILMPWLIRRAMSGVAEVAGQAQAIDIDERGARLADQAVPRELQPLVRAFNAALERLNEGYDARDRFLAGAAHELRLPLAILEARIETLGVDITRARLLADVARLSNLAEQLLDLQRLGKTSAGMEPLDLVALSREVAADIAPLAIGAGYELALDAPESPVMIMGDKLSLSRVLNNLIQNAMAHAGGHGLISVGVNADGSFSVSDQGPGIPVEERQRIFEPFYRLQPSNMGAGLGLHLVREIVTLHGGRIDVGDASGGGAAFRVRLRAVTTMPATSALPVWVDN